MLQRLTGAESIRELPTLRLFKINMNLEMEKGTDALAAAVDTSPQRELEAQPYDDTDIAVIRALQGPMEVVDRPYDAAASEVGMTTDEFLAHLERDDRAQAPAPRRRDPLSPQGGLLRQRHGRLEGARPTACSRPARRWPPCAGSRTATSARPTPDWPYSVFTMAHGRSKEECDAVLDSIADEHELHGADRAVLYSSTEFKKIRLRYFTDEYSGLGARAWTPGRLRSSTRAPSGCCPAG